jgi:hypothetical protein
MGSVDSPLNGSVSRAERKSKSLYSHYVRYDFSTATKLLEISKELKQRYGSLGNLLRQEKNRKDSEMRLQEFRGIGPVTTRIFLRELKKWLKSRI